MTRRTRPDGPHANTRHVATETRDDLAWKLHAVCARSADPDRWFADATRDRKPGEPTHTEITAAAIAACRNACPVRAQCLAYAFRTDQRFGVWGGYSATQRERLGAAAALATLPELTAAAG